MIKFLRILVYLINVIVIFVLLGIHFVVKESSYETSLYFYTFPLPITILIVLVLSIFLKRRLRILNLIVAGILLIIWLGRSFKIHIPETINDKDLEVVFWNASRNNSFEESFNENNGIPDILVLVESKPNNIKELQLKYPDYFFYDSGRELCVFSKTPTQILFNKTSNHQTTVVNFETDGINFYAVDVTGSQDVPRTWELGFVNDLVKKNKNTIVLGDFNVPFESKNLNKLKTNFNHAFNKKGNGFRETWFWNLPLLSLDHIWVSKDLEILKTRKINTFRSDHNMIKTYIRKLST
ncbi:endonuclease/exonuclease/phosphatase family protein [Mariniflexile sp.]|uniref:endonuclease/exonuclease/phosphatase family protein n=1 Tax=Mariniflexile sp. TaxID=1979402 RepID=UPI0040478F4D